MALFKSRYAQHMFALRGGHMISFTNATYQTEDPEIIGLLREVCAVEARGNRAVVEVGGDYGAPPLRGSIVLRLEGFAETTLHLHGESLQDVAERIASLLVPQYEARRQMTPEPDLFPQPDPAHRPEVVGATPAVKAKRGRSSKALAVAQ